MTNETIAPEDRLRQAREELYQEWVHLQIVGRALTPEEQLRAESLSQAIQLLDEVLEILEGEGLGEDGLVGIHLLEGSYIATNDQVSADLRLDIAESAIVSMDLFRVTGGIRSYVASIRTDPGATLRPGQRRFGVIGQDDDDNQARGTLEITPLSETQATVSLVLDQALTGLPVSSPILLAARWQSAAFRTLGVEVDQEANAADLPEFDFDGQTVTVESCFQEAGFEVVPAGDRDEIPTSAQGWDDAQLHGLMARFADESLGRRGWTLHLLLLSAARSSGLLGIMFDTGVYDLNGLPRQGAAVFTQPMGSHFAGFERKVIQTTVHELGHALNLAHRFEREVGRADSTSFMNYDWRYRGGYQSVQFWHDFQFTFDPDEVRFLRHAPWPLVIPGGAEFHTVRYWAEGTGGYSPYVPEVPISDLALRLLPPASGPLFGFAEPVFLTVELTNNSGTTLDIPEFYLDPKAGLLELMIQRISGGGVPDTDEYHFRPILTRCFDLDLAGAEVLDDGETMSNNLNLTFGSAGFTFAEPGNYEVTAILALYDRNRDVEYIVRSNPLVIRIAYPKSLGEERDGLEILGRRDVGYYFALGGSDILTEAADRLEEIRRRRQGRKVKISDPLVAYITRCQAINLSREFITYRAGKYQTRSAQIPKAVSLLDQLEPTAKKIFDPATLRGTRSLAASLKEQYGDK